MNLSMTTEEPQPTANAVAKEKLSEPALGGSDPLVPMDGRTHCQRTARARYGGSDKNSFPNLLRRVNGRGSCQHNPSAADANRCKDSIVSPKSTNALTKNERMEYGIKVAFNLCWYAGFDFF